MLPAELYEIFAKNITCKRNCLSLCIVRCLASALIKMDFTGYPVGKAGLLIVMIMTSGVAYKLMIILMRNLKLQNQPL